MSRLVICLQGLGNPAWTQGQCTRIPYLFFCTFSGSSNASQAHTAKMSHATFMIHPPIVICGRAN